MLSFLPLIGPLFIPFQVICGMLSWVPLVGPLFAVLAFIL